MLNSLRSDWSRSPNLLSTGRQTCCQQDCAQIEERDRHGHLEKRFWQSFCHNALLKSSLASLNEIAEEGRDNPEPCFDQPDRLSSLLLKTNFREMALPFIAPDPPKLDGGGANLLAPSSVAQCCDADIEFPEFKNEPRPIENDRRMPMPWMPSAWFPAESPGIPTSLIMGPADELRRRSNPPSATDGKTLPSILSCRIIGARATFVRCTIDKI